MRVYHSFAGILLAAAPALGLSALAQAPSDHETVVIEGLRLEQTASEAGTAVSVVTAEDIARRALTTGGDAVAIAPGVTVSQSGSFGGVSYARMRGNTPGQTLVLVDGVPVNDVSSPGGGFDFSAFDLADVERIEVLRGPQSTLWGSDAIGGVISVVTQTPDKGFGWRGFAEAGSFETFRGGGSVSGANDAADGRLSAVYQTSDGISKADKRNGNTEKDGFESWTVSGRGGVRIAEGVRADFTARWSDADFDLDGFPPPNFDLADTAATSSSEALSGSATLTALAFGDRLKNVLQITRSKLDRSDDDGAGFVTENNGERTGYRYSGDANLAEGHQLGFGVEREESKANGEQAETNSVFALYAWSPIKTLTLTGGLRYDDDDRYGSETTGKVAASWSVADGVRLRATWGQGFKAPTIFQSTYICSFCGLTAPNSNLKAETSDAYDIGVDWTIGAINLALTAFDSRTENLIDFSYTAGYDNIALAKQKGVELSVDAPLTSWLGVKAGYAYIHAEDGFGADLPRVPENSGDVELILTPTDAFTGSIAVRYNGDQSDGFGPRVPAWTRTDLAATYRFAPGLEVYGRVENLLDEHYQQVGGFGTPGLSGLVGLRLKS
jgi:vitamin B12 transporter